MMGRLIGARLLLRAPADVRFVGQPDRKPGARGLRLRIHFNHDTVHVRIPLLGRNSVHTALWPPPRWAWESKQSWEEIVAGVAEPCRRSST